MNSSIYSSFIEGESTLIKGFVHSIRILSKVIFIELRNVTGTIQIVIEKTDLEIYSLAKTLVLESIIEVEGKIVKLKDETFEIKASLLKIISIPEKKLAIPVRRVEGEEPGLTERLENRFLDLRTPKNQLIFKIWTKLEALFTQFCIEKGAIQIHSPKLMSAASESGAEVFEVKYFEDRAYLAQSPQFYKQMAMAAGFEKIFEIGPVFRAENSNTIRHATEYIGYDVELSYINSEEDITKFEEEMLVFIFSNIKEEFGEEILKYFKQEIQVPKLPFPRLPIIEIKGILKNLKIKSEDPNDISHLEEKEIGKYVKAEFGHDFVFITDYQWNKRAFYHMKNEQNPQLSKSFDLIYKGMEVTTGAQREHRYKILLAQVVERNMNPKNLESYLNFFKYGCPPHGGMGIGPERILMNMLGLSNIREVQYIFRGPNNLRP